MSKPQMSSDGLDWAVHHVGSYCEPKHFPYPFELPILRDNPAEAKRAVLSLRTSLHRAFRKCLCYKNRFGFRQSLELDPLQNIVACAWIHDIANKLEDYRVSSDVAMSNRVRLEPDGQLFAPAPRWDDFEKRCIDLAQDRRFAYVLVADIADFYHAIYFHRIEESLEAAAPSRQVTELITASKLLRDKRTNNGIPVGPTISTLLAEVSLTDLDRHLLNNGFTYCRYVDDFRFFCRDYAQAQRCLTTLSNCLYEQYGLFTQSAKTRIMTADGFVTEAEEHPVNVEIRRLYQEFGRLAEELGFDEYNPIGYEDLDPETQEYIEEMNLVGFLREHLDEVSLDLRSVRWAMSQLRRFGPKRNLQIVLENLHLLPVVMHYAMGYLDRLCLTGDLEEQVVKAILEAVETGSIGNTTFESMWIGAFLASHLHVCRQRQHTVFWTPRATDPLVMRELLLGCDQMEDRVVVKAMKSDYLSMGPWLRRAALWGGHCLDSGERRAWFSSLRHSADPLEQLVMNQVLRDLEEEGY